jgi:GT2 family glycosyltransferase
MMKVSALIFSMNRVENVVSLVEKIKPYVDEVVIVDSSKKEKHKFLKEKLKDARMWEAGDPIKYAGMDEIEKFSRISEKLDPEMALKNFVALMEKKV